MQKNVPPMMTIASSRIWIQTFSIDGGISVTEKDPVALMVSLPRAHARSFCSSTPGRARIIPAMAANSRPTTTLVHTGLSSHSKLPSATSARPANVIKKRMPIAVSALPSRVRITCLVDHGSGGGGVIGAQGCNLPYLLTC
jgi:hypothetical protein